MKQVKTIQPINNDSGSGTVVATAAVFPQLKSTPFNCASSTEFPADGRWLIQSDVNTDSASPS